MRKPPALHVHLPQVEESKELFTWYTWPPSRQVAVEETDRYAWDITRDSEEKSIVFTRLKKVTF